MKPAAKLRVEKEAAPRIAPQPGPQTAFLESQADITVYGGGAGGGKTWGELIACLLHKDDPDFSSVIFRRNLVQVTNPGGLWDEALALYTQAPFSGKPRAGAQPEIVFPKSNARVRFAHLDAEATVYSWQGAQVPLICFDELTHFTRAQFFYMLSRNRIPAAVAVKVNKLRARKGRGKFRPHVLATCNPDADSWVASFLAWWIDPKTGYAIPERAGKLRWMIRVNDTLIWADSSDELRALVPEIPDENFLPKSVTFIPARLSDNRALNDNDPGYRANLLAMDPVERERLLNGNWKIRPAAGMYFNRGWCRFVEALPAGVKFKRGWDLAATPKTANNDPDWTVGVKLGQYPDGRFVIADARRDRLDPGGVERLLANTASADGNAVAIRIPQDPGQAGKAQAAYLIKQLAGYSVTAEVASGDKLTRFGPFSAQARAGNVDILKGDWNEEFIASLEAFPQGAHDDDVDAASEAFAGFQVQSGGLIDFYRQQAEAAGLKVTPPTVGA